MIVQFDECKIPEKVKNHIFGSTLIRLKFYQKYSVHDHVNRKPSTVDPKKA